MPACAVLLSAIEEADQTGDVFGEEDLLETFRDPGRDYPRGSTGVHDGDVMVGYCCLTSSGSAGQVHQMRQYGGVHPAYRGQGIGGRLLDWAELAAVPLHEERYPGLPLSISGWCPAGNSRASALYASRGYQPARWFHLMAADLTAPGPAAPVPAGVQIVAFSEDLAEDARLVRNEAFRDHWQADHLGPGEWAHFLSYHAFRPAFSYLSYGGAEPLGVLIGREYDAYTELTGILDLYIAVVATRRSARKRGIASALSAVRSQMPAPLASPPRRSPLTPTRQLAPSASITGPASRSGPPPSCRSRTWTSVTAAVSRDKRSDHSEARRLFQLAMRVRPRASTSLAGLAPRPPAPALTSCHRNRRLSNHSLSSSTALPAGRQNHLVIIMNAVLRGAGSHES